MEIVAPVPPPLVPLPMTAMPLVTQLPAALPLAPTVETVALANDRQPSGRGGGSPRERQTRQRSAAPVTASSDKNHQLDILA